VRGCHQHGHWMGATAARDLQRGAGQDGRSPAEGDFRRTPCLAVTEYQAGLYFARLVAELAERGLKVDYRSVWEFVHAEKLLGKLRISPNLKSSCFSQSGHHPRHWCRSSKSSKCGARGGERLKSARRVAAGFGAVSTLPRADCATAITQWHAGTVTYQLREPNPGAVSRVTRTPPG
jgi:hypothetical protein